MPFTYWLIHTLRFKQTLYGLILFCVLNKQEKSFSYWLILTTPYRIYKLILIHWNYLEDFYLHIVFFHLQNLHVFHVCIIPLFPPWFKFFVNFNILVIIKNIQALCNVFVCNLFIKIMISVLFSRKQNSYVNILCYLLFCCLLLNRCYYYYFLWGYIL